MKKKVILASASPRRKKLLKKIVKNFMVIPSQVDESGIRAKNPEAFAIKAALAKAEDVALRSKNSLVIGADTIVVLGKKILGKPKSNKAAIAMLKSLVGRTHKVITGIAVVDSETFDKIADFEVTKVKMKKVSDNEINDYVKTGKPLDKAGSYGIQEIEEIFIEKIAGDYENVVGLPVRKLKELLWALK
ncbi:MAG: septum formation protein Maf [Candidatus Margulisbacteria bacterium]|nr:septum formation protein Maf [Candidatus Margulisiibacteriota bacterium]